VVTNENLLVGIETHDDAGIYKISDDLALIQTTDFFPPMVSDPYEFGAIAAANALSDVYAMGGEVLTAMNLVMFPASFPMEVLFEILKGGAEKIKESGGVSAGGHTITDDTPKYGLAVTGKVHPKKMITNSSAAEGDVLILTKPVGCGIILAGKRLGEVKDQTHKKVVQSMMQLNKAGAEIMQKYGVKSATDITGFGLLGHAMRMATESKVTFKINANKIPLFEETLRLADMGCIPGACFRNQEYASENITFSEKLKYELKMILFDAQTSGGLFISAQAKSAEKMLKELIDAGYEHAGIIGEVVGKGERAVFID